MHYRARYYNPTIGRFISEDPRAKMKMFNLYLYGSNRPTIARDPLGLFEIDEKSCACSSPGIMIGPGGGGAPGFKLVDVLRLETKNWCETRLGQIGDPVLRNCIFASCFFGKIQCLNHCPMNRAGQAALGSPAIRPDTNVATFCKDSWVNFPGGFGYGSGETGAVIIHEWAHGCGWKDCGRGGVPDNWDQRNLPEDRRPGHYYCWGNQLIYQEPPVIP